jgi:hypothetical protein
VYKVFCYGKQALLIAEQYKTTASSSSSVVDASQVDPLLKFSSRCCLFITEVAWFAAAGRRYTASY